MEALLKRAGEQAGNMHRIRAIYRDRVVLLGRLQLDCPAHGPYLAEGLCAPTGTEYWAACPACLAQGAENRAREDAAAEERAQQCAIAARLDAANVPQRFLGKMLGDYKTAGRGQEKVLAIARDYVDRFAMHREKGASLLFGGLPGTGKSLLAMIVLQEVCRRGYGARYTTMQGLVLAVRRTWGKEGEGRESDVLDDLSNTSLLVIDEVGVQAGTENEKALLFEVIDRRYADMRPTIMVTNLNKDGFKEFVGDRVWDRLTEVARWVPFAWESYRPTARREMAE